jgi:hypothetical protein
MWFSSMLHATGRRDKVESTLAESPLPVRHSSRLRDPTDTPWIQVKEGGVERSSRFQNWFQIISNAAIIFGLALVVNELNQSKQLALVQFINDDFDRLTNAQLAMMSDDPREALAKAALHPADLTERDVVTLNAWYETVILNWSNMQVTSQTAGLDRPLQPLVIEQARIHFSSAPGRRWLKAKVARRDKTPVGFRDFSELLKIALEAVSDEAENFYQSQYELLLAKD